MPLNETAALVSFGNTIDVEVNQKIIYLHRKLVRESFEGFVESVPAYSTLAVFYQVPATFEKVKAILEAQINSHGLQGPSNGSAIDIPVWYEGDDLDFVAREHNLTTNEVVSIHTSKSYRVFMLGFLPGFPYMGTVDQRIATARKTSPRTSVPAGSVGIAGMQTGIYPQSSPGGWQLIGRTPKRIFDIKKESPCLFTPGDFIRFYPIAKAEFEKLNEY